MDGTGCELSTAALAALAIAAAAGCSSLDPKPASLPYSLYDSPLIAGGVPDSYMANSTSTETAPKSEPEPKAAESERTEPNDEPNESEGTEPPPTLASRATTDEEATEGGSAGASSKAAAAHDASTRSGASAAADPSYNAAAARYVTAIYELNGVAMPAETHRNIPALYRHCREEGGTFQSRKPAAGDLAFFHNVADANDDDRNNDWYTHVALVERIDGSGTVHLLAYRNDAMQSFRMNLEHPDTAKRDGERANSRLRRERDGDPPYTQYLAGQLFAGYCSLLGDKSELLVVDNWEPGMKLEK